MNGWLRIHVHGIPAPQGSKRHVGRGIMVESSKRVAPWREAVRASAEAAITEQEWQRIDEGPVRVAATFYFDRPKSHPKTRRTWPSTRSSGDIDKLLRATLDALTDAGVMRDDSQIVFASAAKAWCEGDAVPGAELAIQRMP